MPIKMGEGPGMAGPRDGLLEAYWQCSEMENQSEIKGKEKYTRILGVDWGLQSPVDTQSGQASGRRQHRPVTIKKLMDLSTPLIIQAISQNKQLEKSEIIICQVIGKEQKKGDKFKVSMEGVRIIECVTVCGDSDNPSSCIDMVKMVFDKITYEDIPSKKMAYDDWKEI
jgi:type VI secretion system secreted protein Hcp